MNDSADSANFRLPPEWKNPGISGLNRVAAHTRWGAYDSAARARGAVHGSSPYTLCLNGDYRFRLYPRPEAVDDFFRVGYDDRDFASIAVPGNWEVAGFDEPIYTNHIFPWSLDTDEACAIEARRGRPKLPNPPFVPEADNPTGAYRRRFTLPESFAGREVFLRFEGVETAFYLWINGRPVGYAQDSKLPVEFEITSFLVPGENLLALQVMRFAASTYLEDQDYWYLSGIYRDVWLVAKLALRIQDYRVSAEPDLPCGPGGTLTVDVTVSRVPGFADARARVILYDPDGVEVASGEDGVREAADYRADRTPTANTARVSLRLSAARLWSPADPALYTVVVTLLDGDGRAVDFEGGRCGFKKVEVKDGVVLLNGERLVVHGVNRHEHAWRTGRTVSREHMRGEIRQMKRMNINSVRTSHYPDAPEWYELCDECGLLLICECNLETHGVMGALTHDPSWVTAFVDRAARMVANYKNHVSIYSWSLGNESGTGPNHAAMYGFVKAYDPARLCQYEAGEPGPNVSDVRGNMYAELGKIRDLLCDPADNRPVILVEYLYQIRNSGGGLEHFIDLTEHCPRFQGGYVWDWQDKCLVGRTEDGKEFFAYGGDFGERFVERESSPPFMTCNGVVLPDLTWKPVAHELKQAYCPVRVARPEPLTGYAAPDAWNRYTVTRLPGAGTCDCVARLREDGRVVAERAVEPPEAASAPWVCEIPHEKKPGREYTIEFVIRQRGATFYAEDGYELGVFQFALESGAPAVVAASRPSAAAPRVTATPEGWRVDGGEWTVAFAKATGALTALTRAGRNYLAAGPSLCFDRPLTGLDARPGWGWHETYKSLRALPPPTLLDARLLSGDDRVRLEFDLAVAGPYPLSGRLGYVVGGDGAVGVELRLHIDAAYRALLRVGLELTLPENFEALEYYGYGPVENYVDRRLAARLGVFSSTVAAQHFPFVPPAECGGHEATRWLALSDAEGRTLGVQGDAPFHFDVHHNTIADYVAAGHDHELPRRPETILHIDAAHAPIGGRMAWSTAMPWEHAVSGGDYALDFTLTTR